MTLRWLTREPLGQFLLAGVAIFVVDQIIGDRKEQPPATTTIEVSAIEVAALREGFENAWGREPTRADLQALIEERVKGEVLYRLGLELGLGEEDAVVRQRIVQKVSALIVSIDELEEPTENELREHLLSNAEDYHQPGLTSFQQVFVEAAADGESLLAQLKNGHQPETLGGASLLPRTMRTVSEKQIRAVFGDQFVETLRSVTAGEWQGPIASEFGLHLVRVDRRTEGSAPEFGTVREQLRSDVLRIRRQELQERSYQQLRQRYRVEVTWPASLEAETVLWP